MPAKFADLTIIPTESSSSAELNAYYILDMAHGAKATGAATPTPTPLDYAWQDPAAWKWLRSQLSASDYDRLVREVWSHGHVDTTVTEWRKITQGAR